MAIAVAIWSGWIASSRFAMVEQVDPLVLAMFRNGVPALVLTPIVLRRGIVPKGASLPAIVLMTIGWGAPFAFTTAEGLKTVPASLFGPLVPGFAPILVALLSWLIFRERLGRGVLIGLVLIAAALAAIFAQWAEAGDLAAIGGAPFLLLSSLGFSVYTLMFRRSGLTALEATGYIGFYSMPLLLVMAALNPQAFTEMPADHLIFQFVMQGLLTGLGAVLAYGVAIRHLGAVRAASANVLVPLAAAITGAVFLGEVLGSWTLAAVLAASLGVAFVNGFFDRWIGAR